jgi:hypothetical protein
MCMFVSRRMARDPRAETTSLHLVCRRVQSLPTPAVAASPLSPEGSYKGYTARLSFRVTADLRLFRSARAGIRPSDNFRLARRWAAIGPRSSAEKN